MSYIVNFQLPKSVKHLWTRVCILYEMLKKMQYA